MLKSIEQILVDMGKLTGQQVQKLKTDAQASATPLYDFLIEQKIITSEDLARAYAQQVNATYIDKVTEQMADPALLAKVPLQFLRQNSVMPLLLQGKTYIVTADPTDFQPVDELNILLGGPLPLAVTTREMLVDAINRYYPLEAPKEMIEELAEEERGEEAFEFGDIEEKDLLSMAQEAPIIKLVNTILMQAVKREASDIHIEPYEKEVQVRYRIDGVLYIAYKPPKRVQGAIVSRIKIMSNLDIAEKRLPQDGRINIKVADKAIDIRVSILPTSFGERVVMRLLDKSRTFADLKELGFSEHDYKIMSESIEQPNGIIMITGPTGSGKTSTLYSILNRLNSPEVNIITVEDPVEYQMPGVSQVQVNEKIGLTFAQALRSILRQDPDIVMIGETRDFETAQIAVQSALTGHLVLTTLHTNSAAASITRLLDMGVEPFLLSSTIVSIVAQRLVRKLCPACKKVEQPSPEKLAALGLPADKLTGITFYGAVGCPECHNTGYKGRLAIFEVMRMSNAIAQLTNERADAHRIQAVATQEGMTLLVEDGLNKIKNGLTTIDEVIAVAVGSFEQEPLLEKPVQPNAQEKKKEKK